MGRQNGQNATLYSSPLFFNTSMPPHNFFNLLFINRSSCLYIGAPIYIWELLFIYRSCYLYMGAPIYIWELLYVYGNSYLYIGAPIYI